MSECICWDYETPDAECTCDAREEPRRTRNLDTREARDRLATQRFAPGTRVRVLPSYRGSGRFAPDGHEGTYTVVGELPNACGAPDYYLAHGFCSDSRAWDLLCHPSRLVPA